MDTHILNNCSLAQYSSRHNFLKTLKPNTMKINKSRDGRTRRNSLASDAIAAFMLLSVYQQDIKNSRLFSGAEASDLTVVHHGNAILNMYNQNDGCIYNIGCLERPISHAVVSNHLLFLRLLFYYYAY